MKVDRLRTVWEEEDVYCGRYSSYACSFVPMRIIPERRI